MTRDTDFLWDHLETIDFLWIAILFLAAVGPLFYAGRKGDSLALAVVLSLLLVHFVQYFLTVLQHEFFDFFPVDIFGLIPSLSGEPSHFHRMFTSAWLHADFIHVLFNILVIALAGVPLEQRLGAKRWFAVYFIGFLGGNLAWVLTHPDSDTPAIGASGAAFGILGAYMACWPEDKIEFPLLLLIKAWPVWLIAFIRLGMEILHMYTIQSGTVGEGDIAHMAHVGGFFLAYLFARPIAKGGPSPIGDIGASGKSSSLSDDIRKQATARMGSLQNDPWSYAGKDLEGSAARILTRLREEGDELETRRAWLEELAEHVICPVCDGEIIAIDDRGVCRLKCSLSQSHMKWP
ncbi:MAG: rhomboid family intramembrane serine protease [Candidatus Thalassarchaeaceae archaeon]|nr:rhomboid family intramembrane serine protease [Candidatus Thalassarchaeaceae archaeon]